MSEALWHWFFLGVMPVFGILLGLFLMWSVDDFIVWKESRKKNTRWLP